MTVVLIALFWGLGILMGVALGKKFWEIFGGS